ncbi:MAG: NAD(P)/FAD-dependent oxidoreductase [Phycisphaerales bacterium]
MAEHATRVAIVGAGLAGGLLANLLGEAGYEIEVFEHRPDPRTKGFIGGRSINLALSARGIHGLKRAGLAERVLADAIPMPGRMIHAPSGHVTFQPYSKNPADAINSVSRGALNIALLEGAARYDNVRYRFEHRCVDVDLERPSVTAIKGAGGRAVEFDVDLVIGCDGAFSVVRGAMQRLDRFDYSQSYLDHGYKELTIPPTATGDFAMPPGGLHIWPRGRSMMIALPNADRSFTCTCFWPFTGPDGFDALGSDDEILRFFKKHFPDAVPLMPTLVADYVRNPTSSLVTVRCGPWYHRDTVVLVGDAAHAVVPFYGQGINAGFEDCVLLADCLAENRSDREQALAKYYQGRKIHADTIADLAIANFLEMRDHVASARFRLKKRIERTLHRFLPRWYTPLYNLVSFTLIPYAEAVRRTRRARHVVRIAVILAVLLILGLVWVLR